jgi:superfamily II DNA or RNA helicase
MENFTLRTYQIDFKKNISISLAKNQHIIACAPTGSGKSKVMISIAYDAMKKGKTVLILTESSKIFSQLVNESKGHYIDSSINYISIITNNLYVAMGQTLVRRKSIVSQFEKLNKDLLIINDECHIGTLNKLLLMLRGAFLIGFTATPDVRSAKHLPILYKDCVVCCQVDDLIQQGFLCTYQHIGRDKINATDLVIKNGEYTEESQEKAFETSIVFDGLLEDLSTIKFYRCMIFCASIKHCDDTWQKLINAGYSAIRYHSKLQNGTFELAKFTELALANICVSVGTLTKGFDYPAVNLIVLLRATTSLPLYLQMMGRGSRPIQNKKDKFVCLDYGLHWKRGLGLYWDDRDWQTMWKTAKKKKKKEGEGISPIKQCLNDKCGCLVPVATKICPYCGYEFESIEEEKELAQGIVVDVTAEYNKLIGLKIGEITPHQLSIYAKMKNKREFAIRVAKSRECENSGWLNEFRICMGYKKGWLYYQLDNLTNENIQFNNITIK